MASQALQEVESARTAATTTSPDLDFEVNLTLPEGLMGQFEGKDVSIEMEYSLAEGASFNSAEITVEDGVPESSFNGKGEDSSATALSRGKQGGGVQILNAADLQISMNYSDRILKAFPCVVYIPTPVSPEV